MARGCAVQQSKHTFEQETHASKIQLNKHRDKINMPLLKHSLQLSLAVQLVRKAHKDSDHTVVIPVIHQCLCAETHHAGEVVSAIIIYGLLFGRHLLTQ